MNVKYTHKMCIKWENLNEIHGGPFQEGPLVFKKVPMQ